MWLQKCKNDKKCPKQVFGGAPDLDNVIEIKRWKNLQILALRGGHLTLQKHFLERCLNWTKKIAKGGAPPNFDLTGEHEEEVAAQDVVVADEWRW